MTEENSVLALAKHNSIHTRVFTFGVGKEVRGHVIHSLARYYLLQGFVYISDL